MSTENMRRGSGGRIENAFATAKEKGEAAFVSFVTAGYPTAEGMLGLTYTTIIKTSSTDSH